MACVLKQYIKPINYGSKKNNWPKEFYITESLWPGSIEKNIRPKNFNQWALYFLRFKRTLYIFRRSFYCFKQQQCSQTFNRRNSE
jgi:hypothetical protein